ncbi:MAG: CRISPR-associated endonuclease Cas1 [Methanoregulaceae archaeon]|jgi:CRISPR-associated endonuclease Cas1
MSSKIPWFLVSGFGAHIKSSPTKLIVLQKDGSKEYSIDRLKHLLIVGGHTLHTSTVNHLLRQGIYISFFEADGTPVGILRPYGDDAQSLLRPLQMDAHRHKYAVMLSEGSIKSRLFFLQKLEDSVKNPLFYEGELQVIQNALDELEYLIKLDEVRRLHRLISDMYYEIISRALPSELGFKQRKIRLQRDPVNAMLSIGYAMLYGNCSVSILGCHLDPDIGILHEGQGGLVQDIIEPQKASMIDSPVISFASEKLTSDDYEISADRCLLSNEVVQQLINVFKKSIQTDRIDQQVYLFSEALQNHEEFKVLYEAGYFL